MTTDGAPNERGAARLVVNDGNEIHCSGHNLQLVVNDPLDPKRKHPPPACAPHRTVVQKAHSLVTFINGHKDPLAAFRALVIERPNAEGQAYALSSS